MSVLLKVLGMASLVVLLTGEVSFATTEFERAIKEKAKEMGYDKDKETIKSQAITGCNRDITDNEQNVIAKVDCETPYDLLSEKKEKVGGYLEKPKKDIAKGKDLQKKVDLLQELGYVKFKITPRAQ